MDAKQDSVDIEKAFQDISNQIKEISNHSCFGIVTQSFSEHTGEVTLALHLITPKLKNYSYRLMEGKSQDFLERYPVNVRLFAKHPSNHQQENCKDLSSLKLVLKSYIESQITKLIINHLISISSLVEEYIDESYEFQLNDNHKSEVIIVNSPNRPIVIKKIVLISHYTAADNEWLSALMSTQIKLTCSNETGTKIEYPMPLISYLSPYHKAPVFDMNFIFPSASDLRILKSISGKLLTYEFNLVTENKNVALSILVEKNFLKSN